MVRGTRYLLGKEAIDFLKVTDTLTSFLLTQNYLPFIPSALADQSVFTDKAGDEVLGQMYTFKDKGERDLCLIPEVTAIVQRLYKDDWSKSRPKPLKLFYLTRCYRYEKPQAGRYREFWQLGVEILGPGDYKSEALLRLGQCMAMLDLKGYVLNDSVKRGLNYYTEDGFEVEVASLGAQKQIAGGGRYDCGIGWAIGIDRLLLALNNQKTGE